MLQNDKKIFKESIEEYTIKRLKFIKDRLESYQPKKQLQIKKGKRNGKEVLKEVNLNLVEESYKSVPNSQYHINIKETVRPESDNTIFTKKYKYELAHKYNDIDLIRFDYYPYSNFPHLHINADENKWGNHITEEETNLNLENLDSYKALNVFEKFLHHPDKHILDENNNSIYRQIIDQEVPND